MLPYFFLLAIPAVFPLLIYRDRVGDLSSDAELESIRLKRNDCTITLFFVIFFVLLAMRDITVGTDLKEYKNIFEICARNDFAYLPVLNLELGYTVYNKLVSYILKNYRFFLIITALITLFPIYKLYSKEKKSPYLLIILFVNMPCFLIIFSGLRQAIAISIGVLAYMALENKKYILSGALILLASLFHVSALVLILLYPAFFSKIKTKHLLYIVPIMLFIYVFRVSIFTTIIRYLPSRYIMFYSDIQSTGAFGMMLLFLIFTVFAFVILDESVMSEKEYFMRNMLLISTLFQFFVPIHGLIQRGSYYFLIFVPISIVAIVQAPKKKLKNISDVAVIVMSVFFSLYFFYNAAFSTDNLLNVFPYKFFWSI